MMTKFFETLGGKLAERSSAALFAPTVLFWAGGLTAWVIDEGSWGASGQRILDWFDALSGAEQMLLAIGALLVLAASGVVVDQVTLPVLRALEGYWPPGLGWLRQWLTAFQSWRLNPAEAKLQHLEARRRDAGLSASEHAEFTSLDIFLRRAPAEPAARMPTRLGNVLRAGETWPRDKYGLDASICWPRLWLALSEDVKGELAEERRHLDRAVVVFIWGGLLLVWVFLTWWALLAAGAVCAFAYWWAVRRAEAFADLVEATFDLYRGKLYDALRLPKPGKPSEEPASGKAVTAFLWRGAVDEELAFVNGGPEQGHGDGTAPGLGRISFPPLSLVVGALAGLLLGRALSRR